MINADQKARDVMKASGYYSIEPINKKIKKDNKLSVNNLKEMKRGVSFR